MLFVFGCTLLRYAYNANPVPEKINSLPAQKISGNPFGSFVAAAR
jgi:hypothetical protein